MAVKTRMNVESVLAADDPVRRLRDAVAWDLAHGGNRDELLAILDGARRRYREKGDEDLEDTMEAVMSFLVGFAPPHSRLCVRTRVLEQSARGVKDKFDTRV